MAESTTGVLEKVRKEGPFNGEHGAYNKIHFEVNGFSGTKLIGENFDFPEEGTNVKVEYVPNGKYTKVLSVKQVEGSNTESKEVKTTNKEKVAEVKSKTTSYKGKTEHQSSSVVSFTTSKDISMEVSGVLQALINTGQYNEKTEKGTFLKQELLEMHLRLALTVKRNVAKELEETGTLS
jgi:hypothetical protein